MRDFLLTADVPAFRTDFRSEHRPFPLEPRTPKSLDAGFPVMNRVHDPSFIIRRSPFCIGRKPPACKVIILFRRRESPQKPSGVRAGGLNSLGEGHGEVGRLAAGLTGLRTLVWSGRIGGVSVGTNSSVTTRRQTGGLHSSALLYPCPREDGL